MPSIQTLSSLFRVDITPQFVAQQSDPAKSRYVFTYTIRIHNLSDVDCQLLSRHWIIKDANQKIEEVVGDGVVGEQPVIAHGTYYEYTSGAVLETEMGTMEGRYTLRIASKTSAESSDDVTSFTILIPRFVLSVPRTLH